MSAQTYVQDRGLESPRAIFIYVTDSSEHAHDKTYISYLIIFITF